MEEATTIAPDYQQQDFDDPDPKQKLYKTLTEHGYYTKSFDDFKKQYSTPESIDKIYSVVNGDQLYTKSKDDFYNQYFSDLSVKKKDTGTNGSQVSSPNTPSNSTAQLPLQESQPNVIDQSLKANDLINTKKQVDGVPDMNGVQSQEMLPDEEAVKQGATLKQNLKSQGYDADEIANDFKDFPKEAFDLKDQNGNQVYSKESLMKMYKDNPYEYKSTINNLKTTYDLIKTAKDNAKENNPSLTDFQAEQLGIQVGNQFNSLHGQSENIAELESKVKSQQEIINDTLTGDARDNAHARLQQTTSYLINPTSKSLQQDYANSEWKDKLDINQYAGLETLKLFKPDQYNLITKQLQAEIKPEYELEGGIDLSTGKLLDPTEKETEATVNERKGLEVVQKSLSDIGRNNSKTFVASKLTSIRNQLQNASPEDEPILKDQYDKYLNYYNAIGQDEKKDDDRYPLMAATKKDEMMKSLQGDEGMSVLDYGLYRFGKGLENSMNSVENLATSTFGSDSQNGLLQLQRQGENQTDQSNQPEVLKNVTYKAPQKVQDEINAVKNDGSLSDMDKRIKIASIVGNNYDKIDTVSNEGGDHNFFSKASLYKNVGTLGDIASFAVQSWGLGELGATRFIANTTPMFLGTQNDFFKQALANGEPDPNGYANIHAAIIAAAGLVNPDLNIVKRSIGLNTATGKIIAGIDEGTWDSIVSENKPLIQKFQNSIKSAVSEAAKVGLTYGAGTSIGSDLADVGFYNKKLSPSDILNHAVDATKDVTLNSLALYGINAVSNFKSVSPEQKSAIWEAGTNPDISIEQIKESIKSGDLSQIQAEKKIDQVKEIANLIKQVPSENEKGNPLTDRQRIDYLYNLIVKSKATDLKSSHPESFKEKLDGIISQTDTENSNILSSNNRTKEVNPDEQITNQEGSTENKQADISTEEGKPTETTIPENIQGTTEGERSKNADTVREILDENSIDNEATPLTFDEKNNIHQSINDYENGIVDGSSLLKTMVDNGLSEKYIAKSLIQKLNPEWKDVNDEKPKIRVTADQAEKLANQNQGGDSNENLQVDDSGGNGETIGIAHDLRTERAQKLGEENPDRGEGMTVEESIKKGKELLSNGADPNKVSDEFKSNGKISEDDMAIVRAKYNELAKATNSAAEKFGINSKEDMAAKNSESKWYNETVKPMQTAWSNIGRAQQGETNIDTGSFSGIRRAYEEANGGKQMNQRRTQEAKELADKVKSLTDQVEGLKKKLSETIDKNVSEEKGSPRRIKDRTKEIANKLRQRAKVHRPDTFSSATPASLAWDGAVEIVAKTIEAGGEIAQAISDGIDHIKSTDWYKELNNDEKKKAEKEFTDWHNDQLKPEEDIHTRFSDKTDSKFSIKDAKDIWEYAKKEYLNKDSSFDDMVHGVSMDLGLTPEQVRSAITQPKGAKIVTDEMYRKQYQQRVAIETAKQWVKSSNTPNVVKALKFIPRLFFRLKTFGHGTVGGITHAGMNIFRPSDWKSYWPNFFRQFKFAFGSTADYEKAMADLVRDPQFIMWKRAGLAIDPTERYDDYQTFDKLLGRLATAGDRGFNALKTMRLDMAKAEYSRLSNIEKSDPQTLKEIATIVNHATGTSKVGVPETIGTLVFAPRLEASRWARLITQPIKAIKTFTNWGDATPSERAAAKIIAKRSGEVIATYLVGLTANQGILMATGSNQNINFTNPLSSDWLKYKVGGKTIDVTGGMASALGFVAKLFNLATESKKDLKGKSRGDALGSTGLKYLRGKLSPFASTATDVIGQHDYEGNTMPFSNDKPYTKFQHKLSWKEYLLNQQTPIPVAEAFKDIQQQMKERGMKDPEIDQILNGILVGVVSGGTGARVGVAEPKKSSK